MKALEVAYLRSFVLAVFQGLQKELDVHQNDIQAALDHCNEAVMEIEITNFLQVVTVREVYCSKLSFKAILHWANFLWVFSLSTISAVLFSFVSRYCCFW